MAEGYGFTEIAARKLLALIGENPATGLKQLPQADRRHDYRQTEWSPLVVNKSGETVPPYSAMAIDGVETAFTDRHTLKIVKPSASTFRPVVFNGPFELSSNDRGPCWLAGVIRVRYAVGQSFSLNQQVGVTGWEVTANGRRDAFIVFNGIFNSTERIALAEVSPLQSNVVFPVLMTQTGGVDGTAIAAATWTYTVTDEMTGTQLATSVNPAVSPHTNCRPNVGITSKATHGLAIYDPNGALALRAYNEKLVSETC